jgi:pyroglutamyl-peptidase
LRKATKPKPPLRTFHCLLTGFDAFGKFPANPTEELLKAMPEILSGETPEGEKFKIVMHCLLLPTSGKKAQALLTKAFRQLKKFKSSKSFVLLTGQAIPTENLRLERLAINFKDYRIPDNAGDLALDQAIDPNGPGLLKTSIDLPALKEKLLSAGWPTEISNHAGTFICNEVYYRALQLKRQTRSSSPVLFLHTPALSVLAKNTSLKKKQLLKQQLSGKEAENLDLLKQVTKEILDFLIQNS